MPSSKITQSATLALCAFATPCFAQGGLENEDREPTLSDWVGDVSYYTRFGFSYGWAGDQQVYNGQPGPTDAADFENVWGGTVATGIDWGVLLGDDLAEDPFTLRVRSDLELGFEALFYDGFPAPVGATEDSDGVLTSWTGTANGFLDVTLPGPFTVFGGAGFGLAVVTVDEDGFSETDASAVWQWMVGASAKLRPDLSLYTQYRVRTYLSDMSFGGPTLDDLKTGAVEIGLRFDF